MGVDPVRSFDDVVKLGKHVKERGFTALKTNIFRFDLDPPNMHQPGFARTAGAPQIATIFSLPVMPPTFGSVARM